MTLPEKYDREITGIISGFIIPLVTAFFVFLFAEGHHSLYSWLKRIAEANIVTHVITLCVFPNVIIFLIFNHFDMLRAARGVLGITIAWAVLVFGAKYLV